MLHVSVCDVTASLGISHRNLLTIAIFYGLPVAQLVITYQQVRVTLQSTASDHLPTGRSDITEDYH